MITKEQLLNVRELKLSGKIALTSDDKFKAYLATVNSFIDSFQGTADKMQDAAEKESWNILSQQVNTTINLLNRIYAEGISKEYSAKFEALLGAAAKDATAIEALTENFIIACSSLSLDIQMAAKRQGTPAQASPARPAAGAKPAPSASGSASGSDYYAAQKPANAPVRRHRNLILAVDNAVIFLNTLKRFLENEPYDVHCVTTGQEALDFIATNRPDMFLLDIEMPLMDGYELARRIKGAGHSAPIVFVTANSSRSCVDRAADVGAVGMLMKPLRSNQLMAKLHEHM
ncbi:MAG: response regulator [Oscillospiraceae bacterium]|nr:response regulator [Oscillospiraceae bacterium]